MAVGLRFRAVVGLAASQLAMPAPFGGPGRVIPLIALALGVAAADQWPVKLATGRTSSLGGVPSVAALLLMPNALAPAAIAAARLAGEFAYSRKLGSATYVAGATGLAALAASIIAAPVAAPQSAAWLLRA